MSAESATPPIADAERLARFVLFSGWIRKSNNSVKPDVFMPPGNLLLSVTRHQNLSENEIWQIGQGIAVSRPATLYGRADISAGSARQLSLEVIPTPQPRHHANIAGWPKEKAAQKSIAQELAAVAYFHSR